MKVIRIYALDKIRSKHLNAFLLEVNLDNGFEDPSPYQLAEMENKLDVIEKITKRFPVKKSESFQLHDMEGCSS